MAVLASIQDQDTSENVRKNPKSNTRGFPCSQCSATFNRSAHLRRHQTAHRGEKPYTCKYCPVSSSRKDVIIRHTRNFHGDSKSHEGCENSPTAGDNDQGRAGASPSTFDSLHMQCSASTVAPPNAAQEPVGTIGMDSSMSEPSQLNEQTESTQANARVFIDLDMHSNDLAFLNEAMLPDDDMLGFLRSHQPADLSLWQVFEPGISLLSPPTLGQGNFHEAIILPRSNDSSPGGSDKEQVHIPFLVHDAEYAEAQTNLAKFDRFQRLSNFRFPSKYALIRFVKAFFEHMIPHLPIIHHPTFDLSSVPSPLLLEIMACGALYSSEQETATNMHIAALQLMAEHEDISLISTKEKNFQLWELQTNLLLSYFGVHGRHSQMRQRALNTFSYTTKLAQEAIKAMNSSKVTTYKDWVYEESIRRCVASVSILGATLNSITQEHSFSLPNFETRIGLPSSTTDWLKAELGWEGPPIPFYSSDGMRNIFNQQRPEIEASDFTFLTIVSAVLNHICSFETIASSRHPELYQSFIDKMSKPLQLLDDMWREQLPPNTSHPSLPSPIMQCTRSLLDSAFYHLYGSNLLTSMKRVLKSPELLDDLMELQDITAQPHSESLGKALVRAAAALRFDCRLGLRYVQKMAPHRFGPLSTTAVTEGSLLLFWYLRYGRSTSSTGEQYININAVMTEVTAELESLLMTRTTHSALLPLMVCAELTQESSVWQWPPNESASVRSLIEKAKNTPPD